MGSVGILSDDDLAVSCPYPDGGEERLGEGRLLGQATASDGTRPDLDYHHSLKMSNIQFPTL